MKEKNKIELDYQKGFNDGYLIAKFEPELSEMISKVNAVSSRIVGMQKGREQYLQEQSKEKLPAWLKGSRQNSLLDGIENEKDRGLEPEI